MTYDVGDTAALTQFRVTNPAGALTNATVTVTVTKPDGSTVSPALTNTATGLYDASVAIDQAGLWTWLWAASGAATAAEPGQLTAAAPRTLVASMAELKKHLNRSDISDDDELRIHLASATDWVEWVTDGPVSVQPFTETHFATWRRGSWLIVPKRRPLVSVISITPYLGAALDPSLYTVDTDINVIRLRIYGGQSYGCGPAEYSVVYRAGRAVIAERVKLAGMIVAAHLWRTQNGGGGLPIPGDEEVVPTPLGFAVPRRAEEMLGAGDILPAVG